MPKKSAKRRSTATKSPATSTKPLLPAAAAAAASYEVGKRHSHLEDESLALALSMSTAQLQLEERSRQDLALAIAMSASLVAAEKPELEDKNETKETEGCPEIQNVASCSVRETPEVVAVERTNWTLKISLGSDTRRLQASWPEDATSSQAMDAITSAVKEGFGHSLDGAEPLLQYQDEDGDVCSLVSATLPDCLSFARNNVLRLALASRNACNFDKTSHHNSSSASSGSPIIGAARSENPRTIDEEYALEWSLVEPTAEG